MNIKNLSYKNEIFIFFALLLLGIAYRILTADYISYGGDAIYKWFQVKRLLHGLNFTGWDTLYPVWNQHTSRWAINGVVYAFQYLFGTHPLVMYACVFFMFSLSLVFLFLILRKIGNIYFTITSCLLYIFYPVMYAIGSQLLPGIFSITYILISIYCFIIYIEQKKLMFFSLHAFFVFLAYSSKITNIFFVPVFMVFLYKNRPKSLSVFYLMILLVLFLVESAIFYLISDGILLFGKLSCIMQGHGGGGDIQLNHVFSFMIFFERWIQLPFSWKFLFFASLISSIYIVIKPKKFSITLIASLLVTFVFFETFAIKSLHPVKIAEPIRVRYLSAILPLMIISFNYICNKFLVKQKSFLNKTIYICLICAIPILYYNEIHILSNNLYVTYMDEKEINESFSKNASLQFDNKKKAYRYMYVFLRDQYVFSADGNEKIFVNEINDGQNSFYKLTENMP
jgi:hypothetical protein